MNYSFQIGKIMGIPIRIHWTWLVIILFVAWVFASANLLWFGIPYGFGRVEPYTTRWIYSFIFALMLFVCVAIHELGHSIIAKRNGIEIKSITLYFFGGVAAMEEIPRNPKLELKMASAGPLISGFIGIVCLLISYPSMTIVGTNHPFTIFLWTLGWLNLILMVFNLLPAFPMDGGRVLRAWLATRVPYVIATKRAAEIGKMFAIFMFVFGLFSFNFLLLFVAFFVYVGASEEEKVTAINVSLEGIKVRNIMSSDVRTITQDMTLRELRDLMFQEKHRGYPVIDNGILQGIITITDLQKVQDSKYENMHVGDIMTRKLFVIGPEEEASTAMKKMNEMGIRRLPVIESGKLVGIVSREDLVRAIEFSSGSGF